MLSAESLECPNCGAPVGVHDRICAHCLSPIFIQRIQDLQGKKAGDVNRYIRAYQNFVKLSRGEDPETLLALGVCQLKNRMYEPAIAVLSKAVALLPGDGEPYFYLAAARMHGKRPFLQTLSTIKVVVQLLETALSYESAGRYFYFLYLIQVDFYDKKRLHNGKRAEDLEQQAQQYELDEEDILLCRQFCGLPGWQQKGKA